MAKKKKKLVISMKLSIDQLDNIINMIYSDNELVNTKLWIKTKKLVSAINLKDYDDDEEATARIIFLQRSLEAMIDSKIKDVGVIFDYCKDSGQYSEEMDNIIESIDDLDSEDIRYVSSFISDVLQYSFIMDYTDILEDIILNIKSGEYDSLHNICGDFSEVISRLNTQFKSVQSDRDDSSNDFDSNDIESMERVVNRSLDELNRSSAKLKTSIKLKNLMLNGGYEAGRFYLYLGVPGGWKSGELLNIALDIKHHNKIEPDEYGRIPTVLFVSQENSMRETLERLWSHYNCDADEFKSHTNKEIMEILNKKGFNQGVNFSFRYRKSKSIDTSDVDAMIDELEEDGKYVVCVIHDYIKRINSTMRYPDLYTELGAVCDEFCNIAKNRNIPVISASQFNREAFKVLEEAAKKKTADPLKELGTSQVGESVKLIDNSDVVISIHKKPNGENGEMMLAYNLLKMRGKVPDTLVRYFAHPFVEGNGMALQTDINSVESKSVKQMGNGLENSSASNIRSKRAGRPRNDGNLNDEQPTRDSEREHIKKVLEENGEDSEDISSNDRKNVKRKSLK